jgi:hypothetical protein
MVSFCTDDSFKGAAFLYETLTDPQYAFSYEGTKAPFMYAEKTRDESVTGNMFDRFRDIVSPACYLLPPSSITFRMIYSLTKMLLVSVLIATEY